MSFGKFGKLPCRPQFGAKFAAVNQSRTYARLENGQIVRVCADAHATGGIALNPKPYRNKADMKQQKRERRAGRAQL